MTTAASPQRRARVAFALAARAAATYTFQTMPTGADEHIPPGGYHHMAERARLYTGQLTAMAVACDILITGATWTQVAATAGLNAEGARHRWGHVVDQLTDGTTRITWTPNLPGVQVAAPHLDVPADRDELDAVAAGLDSFYGRVTAPEPSGSDADAAPGHDPVPAAFIDVAVTAAAVMLRSPVAAASLLRPLLERASRRARPPARGAAPATPVPTWATPHLRRISEGLPD
ncbi:hypothetical protein [Actinomadura yumaensis]|uniref:Uncharacterized protein n=1 Tax=Actinomadura yumaensis TaxID=111807 RepID=A0ABW2CSU0_9ACTN